MFFSTRSSLRLALVLSLSMAAAATSVLAGTVEVRCVTEGGSPLKDVEVFLQALPSGQTESKKSGKDGVAKFKDTMAGVYRVLGRIEGFAPAYFEFLDIEGEADAQATLTFEPGTPTDRLHFEDQALAQRSNDLLVEGIQAFQAGDQEQAVAKVEEALEVNPSNPDGPYNLGILYLQVKDLESAEKALERSRELLGVFVKIYAGTPTADLLQQRLDETNKLLASMPLQRIGIEADAAMEARDFDNAIAGYQRMTELDSENAVIRYNLALAHTHAGNLEEAKASIARALELNPGDLGFERLQQQIADIEKRGISLRASEAIEETQELLKAEKYQEALDKAKSVLEDVPEELQSGTWLLIARSHQGLEQPEEAVAAFRRSIELDRTFSMEQEEGAQESAEPKTAQPDRELASYFFEQERYQEGIDVYVEALTKENADVISELAKLGATFSRQGKNEANALVFEKILEVDPNHAEAYYELGIYHFYDTEQRAKAKQLLEKYVQIGTDQSHLDNAKAVLAVMAARKN